MQPAHRDGQRLVAGRAHDLAGAGIFQNAFNDVVDVSGKPQLLSDLRRQREPRP